MGASALPDLDTLFRKHGAMVYRRAYRLLGKKEDAEEATQEVFVRAMNGLASFDGRSTLTTWLYQITTNYCLASMRDRARRRVLFAQHFQGEERPESAAVPDLLLLRQLIGAADEDQARAIVCVYFDGMSHEQAAEVLGVSKRTIGNLIERFLAWAQKQTSVEEKSFLPKPN